MEVIQLVFYFCTIAVSLTVFVLKITAPNPIWQFLLASICKIIPLFTMSYSIVQIYKYFSIL